MPSQVFLLQNYNEIIEMSSEWLNKTHSDDFFMLAESVGS